MEDLNNLVKGVDSPPLVAQSHAVNPLKNTKVVISAGYSTLTAE
jgi:hypothetical protein